MSEITAGESYTREGLPDEIVQRLVRRADAEQNRHVNQARIADGMSRLAATFASLNVPLKRIADALDRAFPFPPPDEPQEPARNEAGLPVPPWAGEPSEHHEDPPGAYDHYRKAADGK